MESVDAYIPEPTRPLDKPFTMPIEDVFSIQVCRSQPRDAYVYICQSIYVAF